MIVAEIYILCHVEILSLILMEWYVVISILHDRIWNINKRQISEKKFDEIM